jgi:hypothetical protein
VQLHGAIVTAPQDAASDNASNNPTAAAQIANRNPVKTPGPTFRPFGTPGEGQGNEHVMCAGAR